MLLPTSHLTLLVLSAPTAPCLRLLEELPDTTDIIVGDHVEAFTSGAEDADIMLTRMAPANLIRSVWRMTERVRWVHSLTTDVNEVLCPEIVNSPVLVTNSPEVFDSKLLPAGQTEDWDLGPMRLFLDNFERFRSGQPLLNVIDKQIGY